MSSLSFPGVSHASEQLSITLENDRVHELLGLTACVEIPCPVNLFWEPLPFSISFPHSFMFVFHLLVVVCKGVDVHVYTFATVMRNDMNQ